MTLASAALVAAAVATTGLGDHQPLLQLGADPAPGLLSNRTIGRRPMDPPDPARPTLVFVHGFNPTPHLVHFTMAQRFGEAAGRRFGGGLNVLAWEWNGATLVSLRPETNRENTIHQGHMLAAALMGAGLDPARIQIIGHSSGTIVATAAARELMARCRRPLAQLTLLETATSYHSTVFERLAAGSSATVVENYWIPSPSALGKAVGYAGVRNWMLPSQSPFFGVICPLHSDHLYAVRWYLATVANPHVAAGFNHSVILAPPR
jgi:pimeloyl-ACP methyl ester carboxylesterase